MKTYSKSFVTCLSKKIKKHYKDVNFDALYWNKLSWNQTVAFREKSRLTDKSDEEKLKAVLSWGGIRSFKNLSLFMPAIQMLDSGKQLPYTVYSTISSFSKLFSFYNPTKYFILDARVAFTLNYLILAIDPSQPGFNFLQYKSRNQALKAAASKIKLPYYHPNLGIGYVAYNKLVLDVFDELNRNKAGIDKPEIIEMIFFKTADKYY